MFYCPHRSLTRVAVNQDMRKEIEDNQKVRFINNFSDEHCKKSFKCSHVSQDVSYLFLEIKHVLSKFDEYSGVS